MTLDGYFEEPRAWNLEFQRIAWGEELKRFPLDRMRAAALPADNERDR
jgi:hypothetical protein